MRTLFLKFLILATMLLGLPLLGVFLKGFSLRGYLQFPPKTEPVAHLPFSWPAFGIYACLVLLGVAPFLSQLLKTAGKGKPSFRPHPFPWWGWLGISACLGSWGLAWTRFQCFSPLQPYSFSFLWFSFILVINALGFRRTGRCMLMNQPWIFFFLFPVSACFWWFFEYLNRFVHNWYYVGSHFTAWGYFWRATLPFSTVLPAVLGLQECIYGSPRLQEAFKDFRPLRVPYPKALAGITLILSCAGLTGIGIWPDYLFSLLWISPLLIIVSLQALWGEPHVFSRLPSGDWRLVCSSASAALICGLFWEMWNFYSLSKWRYAIPLVGRFKVFEMPLLGYAGYLPFGLQCAAVGGLFFKTLMVRSPSSGGKDIPLWFRGRNSENRGLRPPMP